VRLTSLRTWVDPNHLFKPLAIMLSACEAGIDVGSFIGGNFPYSTTLAACFPPDQTWFEGAMKARPSM
jgi:hypothetical protein